MKPKKAEEWSSGSRKKRLRNSLKFKTAQKRSGWEEPKKAHGGGGGGQGCTSNCLGFRAFTFDTQRLDRLDGQSGPCLALERPAAPALPGLHVQCSQVAREARTASGSSVGSEPFRV